jgi:hypothetical protein
MMNKKKYIVVLIIVFVIVFSALFIRPYTHGDDGQGECPIVIMESTSGFCVGILSDVNRTEKLNNEEFSNCTIVYSGKECNGIRLFEQSIAAN